MRNQKLKALSLLVGSIIIAGGVVYYAANWVRKVAQEKADHRTYSVVIAESPVEQGQSLKGHLGVMQWPSDAPLASHFENIEEAGKRVASNAIGIGEPITESRLAPIGSQPGLSSLLPRGKRAITAKVNEFTGVAGFLIPGNHVDLVVESGNGATARQDY